MTFIFTIATIPNKSCITYSFVNQFFTLLSTFIIIPMLFILQALVSSLHLQVSCHFMRLFSFILSTRLNT